MICLDDELVKIPHVEIPAQNASEVAAFQTDAVLALKTLGFKKDVAVRSVREALEHDAPHDLESLIEAALRLRADIVIAPPKVAPPARRSSRTAARPSVICLDDDELVKIPHVEIPAQNASEVTAFQPDACSP